MKKSSVLMESVKAFQADPKEPKIAYVDGESIQDTLPEGVSTLPAPAPGFVRAWFGAAKRVPRIVDIDVHEIGEDQKIVSLLKFTRDYSDVPKEKLSGLTDAKEIKDAIYDRVLIEGMRLVFYSTYVVDVIENGAVKKSQEYESFDAAIRDMQESIGRPEWLPLGGHVSDIVKSLHRIYEGKFGKPLDEGKATELAYRLKTIGVAGLMDSRGGEKVMEAILEAVSKNVLDATLTVDEYEAAVTRKFTDLELGLLTRLGVLCPKCEGLTWGIVGADMAFALREARQ